MEQLGNTLEMLDADCDQCNDGNGYCEDHITGQDILSVDQEISYKIHLSTGGPASFFSIFVDGYDIYRIEYHFQDWFDGAVRNLDGQDFEHVKQWIGAQVYIEGVT
jgi:hypothetical protein